MEMRSDSTPIETTTIKGDLGADEIGEQSEKCPHKLLPDRELPLRLRHFRNQVVQRLQKKKQIHCACQQDAVAIACRRELANSVTNE